MLLFLNVLQTFLLLLIVTGVGYLVYRSVRGVRASRKSLRSRRREVYGDVMRIVSMLGTRGEIRKEDLLDFRSRTQDAALLFDADIARYIDEIYARAVKLMSTNELLQGTSLPVGEERDEVTVENAKHSIWLADQIAMLGKRFAGYPDVQETKGGE